MLKSGLDPAGGGLGTVLKSGSSVPYDGLVPLALEPVL
jgi:hypothetical protein